MTGMPNAFRPPRQEKVFRPMTARERYEKRLAQGSPGPVPIQPALARVAYHADPVVLADGVKRTLTGPGESMVGSLLMSWADPQSNRPVVEPWMALRYMGTVTSVEDLPALLTREDDAGRYWLMGNEVYLWTGRCYRTATLPAPDPHHVIQVERPITDTERDTIIRAWGGDMVQTEHPAPQRPPRQPASRYPTRPLVAIGTCPRCEAINAHWLRAPKALTGLDTVDWLIAEEYHRLNGQPGVDTTRLQQLIGQRADLEVGADPVDAEVIRQCRDCGQEWGEK